MSYNAYTCYSPSFKDDTHTYIHLLQDWIFQQEFLPTPEAYETEPTKA